MIRINFLVLQELLPSYSKLVFCSFSWNVYLFSFFQVGPEIVLKANDGMVPLLFFYNTARFCKAAGLYHTKFVCVQKSDCRLVLHGIKFFLTRSTKVAYYIDKVENKVL